MCNPLSPGRTGLSHSEHEASLTTPNTQKSTCQGPHLFWLWQKLKDFSKHLWSVVLTLSLVDIFYNGLRRPWKDKELHLLVYHQGHKPMEIKANTSLCPFFPMILPGPEAPPAPLLETTLRFLPLGNIPRNPRKADRQQHPPWHLWMKILPDEGFMRSRPLLRHCEQLMGAGAGVIFLSSIATDKLDTFL